MILGETDNFQKVNLLKMKVCCLFYDLVTIVIYDHKGTLKIALNLTNCNLQNKLSIKKRLDLSKSQSLSFMWSERYQKSHKKFHSYIGVG